MSVSAISNLSLYQLIPSSGQPGAASAAQANPAILPVDDFYSGVPQSICFAMGLYDTTTDMDWKALGTSLKSGDISGAQTALTNYNQSLAASNDSMSTLTAPSDQFLGYLTQIGNALSSGDLATAQSTYGTAQWWQPTSPIIASGEAVDQAANDGANTTQWLQDLGNFASTLSPATSYTPPATTASTTTSESADDKLAGDLATVQSMVHEEDSNTGSFLLQQGYSQTDVNSIVNVLDYKNMTAALGTVTGDIADITKNTDTFTVTSSISNITTSGSSASVVVNSSTNTFQGDSSIGSSSVTSAQAQSGTPSTSASVSSGGESEAFAYSFSIVETAGDGTSTGVSTAGSALQSSYSTATNASIMASEANDQHMLQLVEALSNVTTAQTASDVKEITSTPIVPLGAADPTTSPYYSMMTKSADASMSQVESVLADILGSSATSTATATSSMSGSDGKNEAYSSVSVYA